MLIKNLQFIVDFRRIPCFSCVVHQNEIVHHFKVILRNIKGVFDAVFELNFNWKYITTEWSKKLNLFPFNIIKSFDNYRKEHFLFEISWKFHNSISKLFILYQSTNYSERVHKVWFEFRVLWFLTLSRQIYRLENFGITLRERNHFKIN